MPLPPINLSEEDKTELIDRFIRYCKIDTQSSTESPPDQIPSTEKQFDLARLLVDELKDLGLEPILSDRCYVYCTIPENRPTKQILGLLAHMDVSPEAPSYNIKPIIHKNISGNAITLPSGTVIPTEDLERYAGHDIITSDGSTLLGGDDKCGVAAIMQLVTMIQRNPDAIPHGRIEICFTPDEEIGNGPHGLDLKLFPAQIAYTVDGSDLGEVDVETFNAVSCKIDIDGVVKHTGYGYGVIVNASRIGSEIITSLPQNELPETTQGPEGFYYVRDITGTISHTTLHLYLRDFTEEGMKRRKQFIHDLVAEKQKQYPTAKIAVDFKFQYANMKQVLDEHPDVTAALFECIKAVGLEPIPLKVRGGTDGSQISFMGIPTPNIFSGSLNFHSLMEFVSIPVMYKTLEVLRELVGKFIQ